LLRSRLDEVFQRNPSAIDLKEEFEQLLSAIISKVKPVAIILTGSMAKGRFVRGMSDIDLLIVASESEPRFFIWAMKDVDVEATVYSLEDLLRSIENGNQFIIDAIKNGIMLVGEDIIRRASTPGKKPS
jgi:predicted nucleotidyltransferase